MELHHLAALTQAHNMKHLFRCIALVLPEVRAAIAAMALRSVGGTPQDFKESIAQDRGRRGQATGAVAPR
jgi:hypothetical protein